MPKHRKNSCKNAPRLSAGKVTELPLKMLHADPDQPRRAFESGSLKALADNIKARKVQQPILVRLGQIKGKNAIIIKDGERRWRAAAIAKLKTVPVLLVNGAQDAVQTQLDQVAVNNLREGLKPMELARFLVKLRDTHKLSPNQIAERLEKDGLKAMSRSHVSNLMRLVNLEPWAQQLLDDGTLDATAARSILAAADLPGAMKVVRQEVERAATWKGRVTVSDVDRAVIDGYAEAGIDLQISYGKQVAHFDYRKVCTGCEHLKRIGSRAFCLNAQKFAERNEQAIAAGLLRGGKKPDVRQAKASGQKLTPAQERKVEQQKQERREQTAETRMDNYLDAWLRPLIQKRLEQQPVVAAQLALFMAAGRPDPTLADLIGSANEWKIRRSLARAVPRVQSLPGYLDGAVSADDLLAVARKCVDFLSQSQVRELARHIGIRLETDWVTDEAFLKLRSKAELHAWARHAGLLADDGAKLKASELRELLLKDPKALKFDDQVNLAHLALRTRYQAPVDRSGEVYDEEDEDTDVDASGQEIEEELDE